MHNEHRKKRRETKDEETVKSATFFNFFSGEYSTSAVEKSADESRVVNEPPQVSSSFIAYLFGRSAPPTDEQKKDDFATSENAGQETSFMNWLHEKITGENHENQPTERNEKGNGGGKSCALQFFRCVLASP